jgi:superfamily II DNA or RNA helicase
MKPTHDRLASVLKTGIFNKPYHSFKDLEEKISDLGKTNTTLEGNAFEVFIEAYLCTQADKQVQAFYQVGHIPKVWRDRFNLPNSSTGIDGLYVDRAGEPVLFQVKFLSGRPRVTWGIAQSFLGISDRCRKRFIISNSNDLGDEVKQRNVSAVLGFQFDKLSPDDFKAIHHFLHQTRYHPKPYRPDPHQKKAVQQVLKAFKVEHRTQAIMACGTGKTFAALWVAEGLTTQTVLVLLPSIALLSQTLKEWSKATSWGERFTYMAVCSDDTVGRHDDEVVLRPSDLDFPTTTDPKEIKNFIQSSSQNVRIVFSTYQSSAQVAKAMKGQTFDLGVFDEAHKTTGSKKSYFTEAHQDKFISIKKRLYMTATPRIYKINKKNKDGDFDVLSMDDTAIYGHEAYKLSFGDAARQGIICNYKIVITTIDPRRLDPALLARSKTLIKKEHLPSDWVAKSAALALAIDETKAKRVITFHSRIKLAREFASSGPQGIQTYLKGFETFHVSGEDSASKRESDIEDFKQTPKGLITNARCLTEGVDVPTVDMVAFMDPKTSTIDIAQAIGRAMRKPRGTSPKKIGYIFIPLLVESKNGTITDSSIEDTDYKAIADVINAMQELDEDLKDIITEIRYQTGLTGQFNPRRLLEKISFSGNLRELSLKVIQRAVLNAIVDRIGESWDETYGVIDSFVKNNKMLPRELSNDLIEKRLAKWIGRQRGLNRTGTLSVSRIKKLQSIPGWSWDPLSDKFKEFLSGWSLFVAKKQSAPSTRSKDHEERRLANYAFKMIKAHKENRLAPNRFSELSTLKYFSFRGRDDRYLTKLREIKLFVERKGRLPDRNIKSEVRFKRALEVAKRNFEVYTLERQILLRSIPGFSPENITNIRFRENLIQAEKVVRKHKRLPQKNSTDPLEIKAYHFLNRIRQRKKNGALNPHQMKSIKTTLPSFSLDSRTEKVDRKFDVLLDFMRKNQRLPSVRSLDSEEITLANFMYAIRQHKKGKKLTRDQIASLEQFYFWRWVGRKRF